MDYSKNNKKFLNDVNIELKNDDVESLRLKYNFTPVLCIKQKNKNQKHKKTKTKTKSKTQKNYTCCILEYHTYMRSSKWKEMRKRLICVKGGFCVRCESTFNLIVHHISYKHLGLELKYLNDTEILCSTCHAKHHNII